MKFYYSKNCYLFFIGVFCWIFSTAKCTMNCLVLKPGYGLIEEACPKHTVACGIRIENDAIQFYDSALYDRSQLVCVGKMDYLTENKSGCIRKKTGRVKCWCFGRSNCNSVENSKRLYEAFISMKQEDFQNVVEEIDFSDIVSNEEESPSNFEATSSSTILSKNLKLSALRNSNKNSMEKNLQDVKMWNISTNKNMKAMRYGNEKKPNQSSTFSSNSKENFQSSALSRSGSTNINQISMENNNPPIQTNAILTNQNNYKNGRMAKKIIESEEQPQTKHQHRIHNSKQLENKIPEQIQSIESSTMKFDENLSKLKPMDVKTEYDVKNHMHIIHVGAHDPYENVIGSSEFSKIMEREKAELNNNSSENNNKIRSPTQLIKVVKPTAEDEEDEEYENEYEYSKFEKNIQKTQISESESVDFIKPNKNDENLEEYFDSAFYVSMGTNSSYCWNFFIGLANFISLFFAFQF